jgi:hypothetical protein
MKRIIAFTVTALLLAASTSFATVTAGMTQQAKNDMLTTWTSGTNKIALFVSTSSTLSPSSTTYSTTGELATAHGYTQGGLSLSGCTVASTAGSSPLAADFNCSNAQWTSTDATGITADTAVVYRSSDNHILAIYSFISASASGNGATFTITMPAVSTSTRGLAYIQ